MKIQKSISLDMKTWDKIDTMRSNKSRSKFIAELLVGKLAKLENKQED